MFRDMQDRCNLATTVTHAQIGQRIGFAWGQRAQQLWLAPLFYPDRFLVQVVRKEDTIC